MLLKSDGFPTYHLAVVVDDMEMEISHILRAHEWLPSTPVHILLYQYLNYQTPQVGHFTVILDPEGGKLSKRKGNVSVEEFLAEGYLPEAILNYIMLLGWAPKDNRELFTLQELVDNFQKGSLQIANPVFNQKKLDWFNGYYIRQKTDQELFELLRKFVPENADVDLINKTVHLVKDRITKLSDYSSLVGFFFKEPEINEELFEENAKVQLVGALEILESLGTWDKENLESALQNFIKQNNWNTGQFFMNFRIAITGSRFTPPITDSAEILGKEKTRERIKKALSLLTSTS
jgi:glutamyl-tRNA synthetase